MHRYRISKYDPAFRTASGAYAKDEWTSFSDIGDSFCGVKLSYDEYLRVESAYLETVAAFLAQDSAPELVVVGLENHGDHPSAPVNGSFVTRAEFASVCRSILRDEFWCKLEAEGRFVHIGWDFYMYIGVIRRCEGAISLAKSLGLFVEEFESPYLVVDEETG